MEPDVIRNPKLTKVEGKPGIVHEARAALGRLPITEHLGSVKPKKKRSLAIRLRSEATVHSM